MDSTSNLVIAACTGAFFAFTPATIVLVMWLVQRVREKEAFVKSVEASERRQLQLAKERKHNDL